MDANAVQSLMNEMQSLVVLAGTFFLASIFAISGFRLLKEGGKEERTFLKLGSLELTLNSVVGSIGVLASFGVVSFLLQKFY